MPIESVGRRDPALAAAMRNGTALVQEWDFFVGRRPLRVGADVRPLGAPIPEAATWPRIESWVNTGAVVRKAHVDGAYETWWDENPRHDPRCDHGLIGPCQTCDDEALQAEIDAAATPPAKKVAARQRVKPARRQDA